MKQQQPPPQQQNQPSLFAAAAPSPPNRELVGSCNSTKGIAVAVVDANAIIQGGQNLAHNADRFVSVPEVLSEIRDPTSRHSLNFLPFTVDTMEPSPDALKRGLYIYLYIIYVCIHKLEVYFCYAYKKFSF